MHDRGRRRTSPETTRLIERIKVLVNEERRLARGGSSERLEANGREIARLQERLASAVRRELSSTAAA